MALVNNVDSEPRKLVLSAIILPPVLNVHKYTLHFAVLVLLS
jgi:hypothetical protein